MTIFHSKIRSSGVGFRKSNTLLAYTDHSLRYSQSQTTLTLMTLENDGPFREPDIRHSQALLSSTHPQPEPHRTRARSQHRTPESCEAIKTSYCPSHCQLLITKSMSLDHFQSGTCQLWRVFARHIFSIMSNVFYLTI
jgi:hypothetical protein